MVSVLGFLVQDMGMWDWESGIAFVSGLALECLKIYYCS